MTSDDCARQLIKAYDLKPHQEGGCFSEVYTSPAEAGFSDGKRFLAGSIYFLLAADNISHFHQIDCEEIWYYHSGCGLKIHLLSESGKLTVEKLGLNHRQGENPMVIIPKGTIFAAENLVPDGYTFVSCVTVPKFRYEGFRLVPYEEIKKYGVEKRLCL